MRTLAVLLTLATLSAPALRAQDVGLPVGSKAPGAAVQTLDGRPMNLDQYVGRTPVFIEFWATWCPNCRELEPQIQALQRRYGDRVKFLAVAVAINQTPARAKLYAEKHGFAHEVLFDVTGDAADRYRVPATSYVVTIDRTGKIVYTGLGGDQKLEPAVEKALKP